MASRTLSLDQLKQKGEAALKILGYEPVLTGGDFKEGEKVYTTHDIQTGVQGEVVAIAASPGLSPRVYAVHYDEQLFIFHKNDLRKSQQFNKGDDIEIKIGQNKVPITVHVYDMKYGYEERQWMYLLTSDKTDKRTFMPEVQLEKLSGAH